MKADLTSRLCRCGLLLALAGALIAKAQIVPADMSGDYDDEGVLLSEGTERFSGTVSLHALFSATFDPELARQLHAKTSRIGLQQGNGVFDITVYDDEGKAVGAGHWKKGPDYAQQDDRVTLRLTAKGEIYIFTCELVGQGKVLQLTVERGQQTIFGPVRQPLGVFLFPRRT
ncbi:MAG: hypothetical protein HYV95_00975 [Opitutae bacterium]|nr:hypothetical protein [Opitutae bacterium]